VHNGIIENYDFLRERLKKEGVRFSSETDTEVIVQLIGKCYKGNLLAAVQQALPQLRGSFALALIHKDHPDEIIAAARECPLCIGFDDEHTETIVSSDPNAFLASTPNVIFLRNNEIAQIRRGRTDFFNLDMRLLTKKSERLDNEFKVLSKEGFEHYMLKEIYEQPATVQKALLGRLDDENASVLLDLRISEEKLHKLRSIWILGCGTSSHAGWLGTLLLEDLVRLPSTMEISSEARYRNPILTDDTLIIAISQSGETTDTIAAMREAKRRGSTILGLCNVKNSTLSREADSTLYLNAGPEVSVCSTKAFTSQITVMTLFALYLARLKGMSDNQTRYYFSELKKVPGQIQQVIEQASLLQTIAKKYAEYDNFFFMGRRYMLPTAMEAALKLKEISYVNANGYPAGELKHGPIALINDRFPVVAFCSNIQTHEKIASNLMEVKARGAPILAFAPEGMESIASIADDVFWLPPAIDPLAPFASTIAGQLFAYYVAKERGCDIDQPRNLAKSVTVE
jgi:glucosamine--fructose-6-phosphate aminotransferase (isomerizing)